MCKKILAFIVTVLLVATSVSHAEIANKTENKTSGAAPDAASTASQMASDVGTGVSNTAGTAVQAGEHAIQMGVPVPGKLTQVIGQKIIRPTPGKARNTITLVGRKIPNVGKIPTQISSKTANAIKIHTVQMGVPVPGKLTQTAGQKIISPVPSAAGNTVTPAEGAITATGNVATQTKKNTVKAKKGKSIGYSTNVKP